MKRPSDLWKVIMGLVCGSVFLLGGRLAYLDGWVIVVGLILTGVGIWWTFFSRRAKNED